MSLTQYAISNNRITLAVTAIALVSGLLAYIALPKEQDPGFIVRTAVITTVFPGASPERVELLVTDKIEKKAQEMPEVDNITSESRTGISIINVNFLESYKDMRPIYDSLRRKVDDIKSELPKGINGPIVNDEFGDVFGSVYTLSGEGYSYAELKTVADEIRDDLLNEPDIAKVAIHGTQDEVIYVEYNNARLTELGLTPKQLSGVLASANILAPGGSILSDRERITLETTGNYESIDDLKQTVIQLPDGALVYLGDIARIHRAYVDPADSIARINGQPTIAISVSMREGGDILKLGDRLNELVPQLEKRYPWGIEIDKVWFQADLVRTNVDDFINNLLQAIAIVILVMIVTLKLRTGLVVASLIPGAIIITFFVMQNFGITINQISLAALIIALGLLVDNAIVMVESILVKREQGASAVTAAVESGRELMGPLLISSLTTAAAFMPIALAESAVGEYTADIFYVVTITLLVSWLLAMTFIPLISTRTLQVTRQSDEDALDTGIYRFYKRLLLWSVRHRLTFGGLVMGVFALSMYGMGYVPQIFIAPSEDPVFTGKFEMPLGTSIEATQDIMADIDEFVSSNYHEPVEGEPLIRNWLTFIGDGGPRFSLGLNPPSKNPANSFLIASAIDGRDVETMIAGIEEHARQNHPDLELQLARLENGPPVGYPIVIRLSGPNIDNLYTVADQVTDHLYTIPEVSAVKNTWGVPTKKLKVEVDQERARRAGVTSDDVAYSLNTSLSGIELTEYREDEQLIPVTLRSVAAERQDAGKLDSMSVHSQSSGVAVPLKQVADLSLVFEAGIVERRDRIRTLSLKVQLLPGTTAAEVNAKLEPWLVQSSESWPAGTRFESGGEAEESGEANASIAAKLPLAAMVIILLLVFQFNSIRRPIIILLTIPLGLIGVTVGLLVANSSLGFFTLLGLISLSGIIINNAIVLLDRIKIEMDEFNREEHDAVIHACLQRFRPILLTTATTVFGMMPLWWGGTAMFKPMAITIIFGLAFAAALTLLVVPVLYSAMFRVRYD